MQLHPSSEIFQVPFAPQIVKVVKSCVNVSETAQSASTCLCTSPELGEKVLFMFLPSYLSFIRLVVMICRVGKISFYINKELQQTSL